VLRAGGVTDKGRVRPINEDCFAANDSLRLCVVADGMGGHNAGEVAARLAVDAIVDCVSTAASAADAARVLRTAIYLANVQVVEASDASEELVGMGTTVVAALVAGDRLAVGHVGDSRLYVSAHGQLRQLTHDDSWTAQVLAHDPAADPAALRHHPMRNALTNVVGAGSTTDIHVVEETLSGGEVLLLCTDGVHNMLDAGRLQQLLIEDLEPAEIAANIVRAALLRGSHDNCTAVVARYIKDC